MKLAVSLRVLDARGCRVFGAGIAELLEHVEATGSLSEAARRMGMSYSKAWRITRNLERCLERPALVCEKGGRRRGGARLTPEARELLAAYRTLNDLLHRRAASPAANRLMKIFPA